MKKSRTARALATIVFALIPVCLSAQAQSRPTSRTIDIAPVWSGHPVGFCLLTHGDRQFVAFYDAQRQMTVAGRTLDSDTWDMVRLPERIGWDSHNYITMTIDDGGHIHLSGNMHCHSLVYFRTRKPLDVHSFERIEQMVGRNEQKCTYPRFLRGVNGELLFTYRDGSSGDGDQIYNVYDGATQTWRRLIDGPLISGQGLMNAYIRGPVRDREGIFHICWVWRDTPDCATNHDLSYARSRDLVHWKTSTKKQLELPITIETAEIVDPVPAGGGIINGNTHIGFDSRNRPVLSYHKYDVAGKTQIYNARPEDGRWRICQASDWDYRWAFSGGGSIPFEITIGAVTPGKSGTLTQSYRHPEEGSGTWTLDETTLERIDSPKPTTAPTSQRPIPTRAEQDDTALQTRTAHDSGQADQPGVTYSLHWQTLGPNRDRPREGPPPPPSMLRLRDTRTGR